MISEKIFFNLLHLSISIRRSIGKKICWEGAYGFLYCLTSTESKEIISSEDSEESSAPSQEVRFPKLEDIDIQKCNKLKTVFCSTVVTSLPKLQRLCIRDCNEWEGIISSDLRKQNSSKNICFPMLQSIWIERCNKLKTIFFATIVSSLPNLEYLTVFDCNNLEAIISPYSTEAPRLRNLSAPPCRVSFPKLGNITIAGCSKLKHIFFAIMLPMLPKLNILYVTNCNELEDIISSETKSLRNLSTSSQQVCYPTFQKIEITRCYNLKKIFSLNIVGSLPQLQSLYVHDCNELEEIFFFDLDEAGLVENISSPSQQVCLPKIDSITIISCNKLKCIFPYSVACHCSSLGTLHIESCSQLEQIVKFEHKATTTSEEEEKAIDDNLGKHVLFPNLHWLRLRKLPTLTWTYPWYEPQNCYLSIEDCPKYLWFTQCASPFSGYLRNYF